MAETQPEGPLLHGRGNDLSLWEMDVFRSAHADPGDRRRETRTGRLYALLENRHKAAAAASRQEGEVGMDHNGEIGARTNIVKRCPFCAAYPTIEPWHGGAKTKTMVSCSGNFCHVRPGVTGATRAKAIRLWNFRPIESNAKEGQ